MFAIYFVAASASLLITFGFVANPLHKLAMFFPIGFAVFGVFGAFTYYLPELYPTRLRATGAGFTYNSGRLLAAFGPFFVAWASSNGLRGIENALFYVGFVPLVSLCVLPLAVETKGQMLQ